MAEGDSRLEKWLKGAGERAGKTALQTLSTGLLALNLSTVHDFGPIGHASVIAISAAVVSVFTSIVSIPVSQKVPYWANALMRAGLTFVQTIVGLTTADHPFNLITFHWPMAVATSAVAAASSLLTSIASGSHGDAHSPSLVRGVR